MKKLLLIMIILSTSLFAIDLNVALNINSGDIKFDNNSTLYDYEDRVWALQLELTQSFVFAEIGVGATYEDNYEIENQMGSFNALPIYGIGRVYLFPIAIKPYVVVKGGIINTYNEKDLGEIEKGRMYAGGIGVKLLGTLNLEGLYSYRTFEVGGVGAKSSVYTLSISYQVF